MDQVITTALPFIACLVSYLIQKTHWSSQTNTAIAGATVILCAAGTLFVQHKITGNVYGDFLAAAGLAAGLQTGALAPLSQWLKERGSRSTVGGGSPWTPSAPTKAVDPQTTQYGMSRPGDMPPRG